MNTSILRECFVSGAIQFRVIHALIMREVITRYGRHNIGFLWLFVEPMLFSLGVMAFWAAIKISHDKLPIAAFAITGYSSILLWRNVANRCSKAIEPNLTLMYHRNVKVIDIFFARVVLEVLGASASLLFLTLTFSFLGLMDLPQDIFKVLLAWVLLVWFSMALGFVVGSVSELSETFDRVWHIFTYLLFPLAGAGFMVDWLPTQAKNVVLWLPMVHATEMLRHGYFGQKVPTYESVEYFMICNLILTFVGVLLVKRVGEVVEPE